LSITTNAEAIAVSILLRELYDLEGTTFTASWDNRPDPEDVKPAAKLLADSSYKKLMAGVRSSQIEDADIRTLSTEELVELDEIFDEAGIEG